MILPASEKPSANLKISFLRPAAQYSVMPDAHKFSWRDMHQESSDEFDSGKCKLFPFTFIAVVFDGENDFPVFNPLDSVIADSNAVSILAEVIDNGLSAVECSFAVRLPFF